MGSSILNEFPKPDYGFDYSTSTNPPTIPKPLRPGDDPTCRGTGWLWQDAYGNQMKCWRCAGTGIIPNLIAVKPPHVISPLAEGDPSFPADWTPQTENPEQG